MRDTLTRVLLDHIAGGIETRIVRALRLEHRYPPLFVVGTPRSGTTLVYQHLARRFRFAFFPNVSKVHPRACITAAALMRLRRGPSITYESRFGIMEGAAAPSDGWDIFHRWFPRDDYSVPVDEAHLYELGTIVRCFELLYGAPFLNKNNSNSVRVDALGRLFPDALFVHVDRDLAANVDSLERGRREHAIAADEWWAAPPPAFALRSFESEIERVVAQAVGLRDAVRRSFERLPETRRISIAYEEFCAGPATLTEWVRSAYADRGVTLEDGKATTPEAFASRRSARARDPEFRDQVARIAARLERELAEVPA